MPQADRPETLLDHRLVRAAMGTALLCAPDAALLGWAAEGREGAYAALWGVGAVGANGAVSAAISARGAHTRKEIGVGLVVGLLPVRLLLLWVAIAIGIGPLDLPKVALVLAVCGAEVAVIGAQMWQAYRGTTFVGPLLSSTERRS